MQTVEKAIGQRLQALREQRRITRAAMATAAQSYGLAWTRSTIGSIESGRKVLTYAELAVVLTLVLQKADPDRDLSKGSRVYSFGDVIPKGDDLVKVSNRLSLPIGIVRDILLNTDAQPQPPVAVIKQKLVGEPDRDAVEASADAEIKAASALKVTPEDVVRAAHDQWKCSLSAERDRRLVKLGRPLTQGTRGRMTRQLLAELRPLLKKKGRRQR
jgi:transcriptional regulator with XRE-family HTH domain